MSIEDRLTAELEARAHTAPPPQVQVAALARVGRQERRRRTTWTSVGAAAAAAVAIGSVTLLGQLDGTGRDRPAPPVASTSPTPTEAAPAMPYLTGSTLHVGERSIAAERTWALSHANGTTVVGSQWEGPWFVVDGDRLVRLPTDTTTPVGVILSDDGTRAAWVNTLGRNTQRVVLWDVASATEIDRVEVSVGADFQDQISLDGIDEQGRVTWTTFTDLDQVTLWRPGADPVPVTGLPGSFDRAWPGGIVAGGTLGRVSDAGAFTALRSIDDPESTRSLWSPDGTVRVRVTDTRTLVEAVDGQFAVLPVTRTPGGSASPRAWISPTEVVLGVTSTDSDTVSLVRCDVVALTCEVAEPGLPDDTTLPDRPW